MGICWLGWAFGSVDLYNTSIHQPGQRLTAAALFRVMDWPIVRDFFFVQLFGGFHAVFSGLFCFSGFWVVFSWFSKMFEFYICSDFEFV
jgi:hypothetical protein